MTFESLAAILLALFHSMREERTEVLVVGAGPVGLWTALMLAEAGVEVIIVDREERTAARSYACALHPRTLKLFQSMGLLRPLLEMGRRIQTVAFYEGSERRAELNLPELVGDFLLIVPQNQLEKLLEQRLLESGVAVQWSHRFDDLSQEEEGVTVAIEELGGTGTGYIVPHWESTVKNRRNLQAQFLIGADGHHSLVRQRLGLRYEQTGDRQVFAAFEFECEPPIADEVRVVLGDTTNVLWPLPNNKCRWTFQLHHDDQTREFPEKERRAIRIVEPVVDERIRQSVQKVAQRRAPWFTNQVRTTTWCTEVVFEPGMANAFGGTRCWLAGDAAHQTGPVGVQSMNVGFREGKHLADSIRRILREDAPLSSLEEYSREQSAQWRELLGLTGGLKPAAGATGWPSESASKMLSCLPGSRSDLAAFAQALNLTLAQNELSISGKT